MQYRCDSSNKKYKLITNSENNNVMQIALNVNYINIQLSSTIYKFYKSATFIVSNKFSICKFNLLSSLLGDKFYFIRHIKDFMSNLSAEINSKDAWKEMRRYFDTASWEFVGLVWLRGIQFSALCRGALKLFGLWPAGP